MITLFHFLGECNTVLNLRFFFFLFKLSILYGGIYIYAYVGFPGGSAGKESSCNAGDLGSIPRWGRSPAEGNGIPLQCSCLDNPVDRGAWRATLHWGCKESDGTEELNTAYIYICIFKIDYAASAKSIQLCPTLCHPIDGSPPGSPVPGILQARTLEWVAISFSNA